MGKKTLDAHALAERQLELDRARTSRFPQLFAHKQKRMSASPLAFLRGAAPLFYEILEAQPELATGPGGEGWIVGDLHMENFGAYRPEVLRVDEGRRPKKAPPVVFTLNDFDDAVIGPWRLDVLRLTTSLLLAGRELGRSGVVALELVRCLLESWEAAVFDGPKTTRRGRKVLPAPVKTLVGQVQTRSRSQLLDARTHVVSGSRRFTRGPRYASLPRDVLARVPKMFDEYIVSLDPEERPRKDALEILDVALRIAGTGSLGGLRIAILVKGKGGKDGAWIFDLKEQGKPSAAALLTPPKMDPARRVVAGFRACVERPPRMMGTSHIGKISMFGRRLSPQEDKLDLKRLHGEDLPSLARYLGAELGRAHARGATKPPRVRWSPSDLALLTEHAVTLAGVHEAVYLVLCHRMHEHLLQPPGKR